MHALDVLYISLAFCAFLLVGIIGYLVYHIVQAIQSVKVITEDVADIAEDVKGTKNFLKREVLGRLLGLGRDVLDDHYGQKTKRIAAGHIRH